MPLLDTCATTSHNARMQGNNGNEGGRLDRFEEKVMRALSGIEKELRWIRTQREGNQVANGSQPISTNNTYNNHRSTIQDPRGFKSSNTTSYVSVGRALFDGIEAHNKKALEEGSQVITQMDRTPRSFNRDAMKSAETFLGASKVFGPHIGQYSYQEIKSMFANKPEAFQSAYSSLISKLTRSYPILELANRGWAATS